MLLLALGIVDVTYMFYEWALASKATYRGARVAVVSNPVASNATNISFSATQLQNIGQLCFVPTTGSATSPANCPTITNVSCVSGDCGAGNTYDSAAFTRILTAMQTVFPRVAAGNVQVIYTTNGLGYVGLPYADPSATQFALPMNVTVSVTGMTHQFFFLPGLLRLFGGNFLANPAIPVFSTTMQSASMFTQ
jgi:hypothetical protein